MSCITILVKDVYTLFILKGFTSNGIKWWTKMKIFTNYNNHYKQCVVQVGLGAYWVSECFSRLVAVCGSQGPKTLPTGTKAYFVVFRVIPTVPRVYPAGVTSQMFRSHNKLRLIFQLKCVVVGNSLYLQEVFIVIAPCKFRVCVCCSIHLMARIYHITKYVLSCFICKLY